MLNTLIKLSDIFSPESRYVQMACQGILRSNNFKIEQHEIVVEIEDVFDLMAKILEEENKNMK